MSELGKDLYDASNVHLPERRLTTSAAVWYGGVATPKPDEVLALDSLASAEPIDQSSPDHFIIRGAHD